MAHHPVKPGYAQLVKRLNRFPQGATVSVLLFKILEMLFSEKEARLVSMLPIRPFGVERAAGPGNEESRSPNRLHRSPGRRSVRVSASRRRRAAGRHSPERND